MVNSADILIFDRALMRKRRNRQAPGFSGHDFLIEWTGRQIAERLRDIKRHFPVAVHIGSGAPEAQDKTGTVFFMDPAENTARAYSGKMPGKAFVAEEDCLPLPPHSIDLLTSSLCLHMVNDLPGALLQIQTALKPDGLFIGALFGGETLHELRESLTKAELATKGGASPRVLPFADKQQMGALLQRAGYALPVIDSEIITVTYDNMFGLMHDLRGMGESNIIAAQNKRNPGKEFFMKAAEYYHRHHSEPNGKIRASFEVIFLAGWAPHASQQQPLQPGSAQTRLADALDTREINTGETTR